MKKVYKMNAFTFAEVLLTLIVIGVVSVLTVPTLRNHAEEAKFVAATQKAMSEIAAATTNVELAHGDASMWNFGSAQTVEWYKEVMNVIPVPQNELTWKRYTLGNQRSNFPASFITADGMAWSIGTGGYSCGGGVGLVDVNGPEPPNTIGIDMHGFRIGHLCSGNGHKSKSGEFGIYAMGDMKNDINTEWGCTSYVIKHKKMPWLYNPPVLSDGQSGCQPYSGK